GERPDVDRPTSRPVPAQNLRRITFQEKLQCRRRESPIIVGESVNVKIKRAGNQQHAIGPEHSENLLEPPPKSGDLLESANGDPASHGSGSMRQGFDTGDAIAPRPRPFIQPNVLLTRKQKP